MPDKQEMRAKARELLDSPRGKQIMDDTRRQRNTAEDDFPGRGFKGGRKEPVPEGLRGTPRIRGERNSSIEPGVLDEAYELAAARTPRKPVTEPSGLRTVRRQVGPMTEDTRRQTRRGVRGEAPKFADGGKVRGDGICQRGKTKGRLV